MAPLDRTWADPVSMWTDPVSMWADPVSMWTDPVSMWTDPVSMWTDPGEFCLALSHRPPLWQPPLLLCIGPDSLSTQTQPDPGLMWTDPRQMRKSHQELGRQLHSLLALLLALLSRQARYAAAAAAALLHTCYNPTVIATITHNRNNHIMG